MLLVVTIKEVIVTCACETPLANDMGTVAERTGVPAAV